jgi:hypothetical protein
MSLSYTHRLIPLSPEFRPEPPAVAAFGQGVINHGHIGSPITISFSRVSKGGPRERKIRNAMTGETINIRASSRQREQPQTLSNHRKPLKRTAEPHFLLRGYLIPYFPKVPFLSGSLTPLFLWLFCFFRGPFLDVLKHGI